MKQLTLIRHGAAMAASRTVKDFDRPLDQVGLQQAANMGQLLKQQSFSFEQMFCSKARRAQETAQIIYAELGGGQPLFIEQALYTFDADPLYRFIEMLDEHIESAVIVAHNPGLSYLANSLLREPIAGMNTCTVIQMSVNISEWVDINANCAELISISSPPF